MSTREPDEVGTGAGEATLRVNRSMDCPEAPAQARPIADLLTRRPDLADIAAVGVARSLALRSEA